MLQEKQTWYVYSSSLCVWFALISLYTGEPSGISKLGPTLVKILRKYIWVEKIPLNSWGSNDDYNLWTSLRWLYWFLSTLGIQVGLDTLKHAKIDCYGFILIILSLLNYRYDDNFSSALQWCQETFGSSSCGHAGAKFWHHAPKVCEFSRKYCVVIACDRMWSVVITIGTHLIFINHQ